MSFFSEQIPDGRQAGHSFTLYKNSSHPKNRKRKEGKKKKNALTRI
jgi:hypothetical protein